MCNFIKTLLVTMALLGASITSKADNGILYTAEKLSSSMIDYIIQDHYGYIWIATQYGLNKFDGYRFTQFLTDKNDTTTITNNNVTRMLVDSKNRLWIGCQKGLCRYNYEDNTFIRYSFPNALQPRVESIIEDSEGNLLISTSGRGLFAIHANEDRITAETKFAHNKSSEFLTVIFEDALHQLWIGYPDAVVSRYKVSALQPTASHAYELPCGPVVQFLKTDTKGFLLVCMYGIMRYDYSTRQLHDAGYDMHALEGKISIRAALIDHAGNIYIGTSGKGVMIIPRGSDRLQPVESPNSQNDLATANVNNLYEDKDHNLWVSCYKKGIYELSQGQEAFNTWKFAAQNYNLGSSVSSMAPGDDGTVWCTVQKSGIYRFDREGRITPAAATPDGANCIYRDKRGNYWVGSENTLYSYNPTTGASTQRLKADGWGINCMTDDGEGTLYICNYGKGMSIFNTNTGETQQLNMYQTDAQRGALCNDWIKAMMIDSHGLLWMATSNGVCVMNPEDHNFRIFGWDVQLSGTQCFSLCEQRDGTILIGTENGLYIFDRDKNKTTLFSNSEIIQNHPIYTVMCGNDGDIWMSTANGIWQYDQRGQRFLSHISGNGLDTHEFIVGAVVLTSDYRICYASNEGIVSFAPDHVKGSFVDMQGEVFLTNFMIDGKAMGCLSDRFTVDYDQNSFTLEFSMLNFKNTTSVNYEYRMNNGPWTAMPNSGNSISFNRMKPGKYIIEVRAVCNGVYSSSTRVVTVVVRAPWYASTWAYILYALLFMAMLSLLFYYLQRKQRAKLNDQKMRFLINATHDIRSPLTLIMGPLNKLKSRVTDKESKADVETIDRNAQRLLLLVNQILDERRIDKKQMHLHCSECDLVSFTEGIGSLFQFNAKQRNITFRVEHPNDSKVMVWIDHIQFDKVVSNLLSNAFKYTFDGGEVTVVVSQDGTNAQVKVMDTGIGLKDDDIDKIFDRFYQGKRSSDLHIEGTGIGLNLSQAITQMHGGHIKAQNRDDNVRGACFTVTIPLGKAHLKPEEIVDESADNTANGKRQASKNFRLLVVDDDQEVARYIKNELGNWYRIDTTVNGKEALKMLLTNDTQYDLVVSDIIMPEMDGITLLKQMKSNPNVSHIPVILLTSKTEVSDRLEGLKKGADAYLAKPFNMEELHILIDNIVDNVRRLKGKFTGAQTQQDKVENVEVKGNNDTLMERIMRTINENLQDPEFNVDKLTEEVGISRTQLHRKMKEITGISTGEFIRNQRLQQAARLISEGKVNIAQVAYSVGFNNQTYFSTLFKKYFGMTPTEYGMKEKESHP